MTHAFPVDVEPGTGLPRIRLSGRIDSLTAGTVQNALAAMIDQGERTVLVDMREVGFLSSAGIRAFLVVQKQLHGSSGELVLVAPTPDVRRVFESASLTKLFALVEDVDGVAQEVETRKAADERAGGGVVADGSTLLEVEGLSLRIREGEATVGRLRPIGSHELLLSAAFRPEDVCAERLEAGEYAVGVAAAGEHFDDYRHMFGEALVVDGNFFVQPAVSDSRVDYVLREWSQPMDALRFLHGFGFAGGFRRHLMFEDKRAPVELERLQRVLFTLTDADLLGVVMVAESLGHRGMALLRIPLEGALPDSGATIMDGEHLADWLDFSLEPSKPGRLLLACGLLARDRSLLPSDTRELFPQGCDFHLHALVLNKGHLSRRARDFRKELARVLADPGVDEVCHLLPGTQLRAGLLGLIELEG